MLREVHASGQLTNGGPMVVALENRLRKFLGADYFLSMANGTLALQIAIQALQLKGEVITTPYTYVATANSILWEHCTPIFVDIDPTNYGIDPRLVTEKITPNTTAILGTHVYGIPNDIEGLSEIAEKHGLKLLFDAAHCFGVTYKGKSLTSYGDASTLSFHATKVFHTVEGGGLVLHSEEDQQRAYNLRYFGHQYDDYFGTGNNAKMSEVHAVYGHCVLDSFDALIAQRKVIFNRYIEAFSDLSWISLLSLPKDLDWNYGYFPLFLESEGATLKLKSHLEANDVFPRRYFYPSINTLNHMPTPSECPVSESLSTRVLCLPVYPGLDKSDQDRIIDLMVGFH
ncbi:MAG: DegT/DnrJ/EryC1/StrS family aminotransferase [Salibacteraceae bacterium]